jgi:hypothetical protein
MHETQQINSPYVYGAGGLVEGELKTFKAFSKMLKILGY